SIEALRVGEQDAGMTAWLNAHVDLVPAWPVPDTVSVAKAPAHPGPPPAQGPVDRRAVLARLDRYYSDLSSRAWSAFTGHFWPGATLTTVYQPADEHAPRVVTTSVPAFVAQATEQASSRTLRERMVDADVVVMGNIAQVRAHYEAHVRGRDGTHVWRGTDAFTLMKHGGEWRIVSLAYTANP
ncbi:MAG TPA: DUF4440 domain-containing protein, partial [Longimicrobiales bacterium]|nr:DUF4440 domain-containing protein [Longimicrobiales bacterium]